MNKNVLFAAVAALISMTMLANPSWAAAPACRGAHTKATASVKGTRVRWTLLGNEFSGSNIDPFLKELGFNDLTVAPAPFLRDFFMYGSSSARGELIEHLRLLRKSDREKFLIELWNEAGRLDAVTADFLRRQDYVLDGLYRKFSDLPNPKWRVLAANPKASPKLMAALLDGAANLVHRITGEKDSRQIEIVRSALLDGLKNTDPDFAGQVLATARSWPESYRGVLMQHFVSFGSAHVIEVRAPSEYTLQNIQKMLQAPHHLVRLYDLLDGGMTLHGSKKAVDHALEVAKMDDARHYPSPLEKGQNREAQRFAIELLGRSLIQDSRIVPVLRELEKRENTRFDAQMALLRRQENPADFQNLVSSLNGGSRLLVRELVDIHSEHDLQLHQGFSKLHGALRESALSGGMVDEYLVELMQKQFRKEPDDIKASLKFILDLGLTGPKVREYANLHRGPQDWLSNDTQRLLRRLQTLQPEGVP